MAPGSARVAYVASAHQHWGLATFVPAPGTPSYYSDEKTTPFGSDYRTLAFVQPKDCPWSFSGKNLSIPFPCPSYDTEVPGGVLRAWHIKSAPAADCAQAYGPLPPR